MVKYEVGDILKVITIKQPFATLIAKGLKKYEFRTWKTKYRGEILIHAGKGIDKIAMKRYEYLHFSFPKGCIIAKANLSDCVDIDEEMRCKLKKENELVYYNTIYNKTWNGYGFKLENRKELEPIYIKGKLGLWNYEGDINEKCKSRSK